MSLQQGQFFKNYKELCIFLGESPVQGKQKLCQLERWQRFFSWEKFKNSYKIKEVFMPYEKESLDFKNSRWAFPVSKIIIAELHKALQKKAVNRMSNDLGELVIVANDLYNLVGLCNKKLKELKEGSTEISVNKSKQRHFYLETGYKFYTIIDNVLESLHKKRYIYRERTYVITRNGESSLANFSERKEIHLLLGKLLRQYECKSEYIVLLRHQEDKFYKEFNTLLKQELNIDSCFKVHRIGFTEESLQSLDKTYVTNSVQESYKIEVNRKSYEDLEKSGYDYELIDLVIPL